MITTFLRAVALCPGFQSVSWGAQQTWNRSRRFSLRIYNLCKLSQRTFQCQAKNARKYIIKRTFYGEWGVVDFFGNYLITDFTMSLELNPSPWTTLPMAASTPKRSVTFTAPFSLPVVHPRERLVAGWKISFPGS